LRDRNESDGMGLVGAKAIVYVYPNPHQMKSRPSWATISTLGTEILVYRAAGFWPT
jgi:hypothetical protein